MNDRKRQVLLTAQHLFMEKGFQAVSVQDILAESKISKGTFYNYFSSKNECLMAILEHAHEDASIRRRELQIGQDISNKDVLAEQISIRMQVNRENNLFPLFEAVFHSGDQELSDFVKKHHLAEVSWITKRLVDIYGKEAAPYAPDCAVLLLGMVQHMSHVWMAGSKELVDNAKLIYFIMRRMDSIVANMIDTKDLFLGEEVLSNLYRGLDTKPNSREELREQLNGFQMALDADNRHSGMEYIHFLMDELNAEHPRVFLIETVTRSFIEAFVGTDDGEEAREIASKLWGFIDTINKDE